MHRVLSDLMIAILLDNLKSVLPWISLTRLAEDILALLPIPSFLDVQKTLMPSQLDVEFLGMVRPLDGSR